jgi:hypothetical protein
MKFLRATLLTTGLAAVAAGCDITDLDINRDPDAATEESIAPDQLFPTAILTVASNRTIEIGPSIHQHAQIWASNGSTGVFSNPDRYFLSGNNKSNSWNALYGGSLRNLAFMRNIGLSREPARPNVGVQADILSAYIFWVLTSIWEDVPYTQATNAAEFPNPEFDRQEVVLRGIVAKLDSAVARIDASQGAVQGDLIYGGNMENWRRFANSLQLRTLMMIRNRDQTVDARIEALLAQPLIRENAQEAAVPFFNTTGNENNFYKLNALFGGFNFAGSGQVFMFAGKPVVDLMKSLGDPRLDTYFALPVRNLNQAPDGGGIATTEHVGQSPGVFQWNTAFISTISQNIARAAWPNRILTAPEVWFFEAEFRARQGNLGAAHTAYVAGVQRGLAFFNGKPGAIPAAQQAAYIASLPQSFTSQTQALEAIWAQQYIEVFDRAPENWVQWRRTKYPNLEPPNAALFTDGVIRRWGIPGDEISANPNAPANRAEENAVPMWFEG